MSEPLICEHMVERATCDQCKYLEYQRKLLADGYKSKMQTILDRMPRSYTQVELDAATLAATQRMECGHCKADLVGEECGTPECPIKVHNKHCRTCAEIASAALATREQAAQHRPERHSVGYYSCACGFKDDSRSVMIWWPEHIRNLPLPAASTQALDRLLAGARAEEAQSWAVHWEAGDGEWADDRIAKLEADALAHPRKEVESSCPPMGEVDDKLV